MKPIKIAEQYETTHLDGDAPLGQSETKDGVGINSQLLPQVGVKQIE